jgi:hypothetical protein
MTTQRVQAFDDPHLSSTNDLSHSTTSSSSKILIVRSFLTWFLMLSGDNMHAMTWASTSTYKGNKKILEGLSSKSFVKKKGFMGVDKR